MSDLLDLYEAELRSKKGGKRLRMRGAGVASGGYYREVTISGAGRVEGDIEADTVKASGSAAFNGGIAAREVKFAGAVKVRGNVKSVLFHAAGAVRVEGRIDAEEVKVAGALKALGVAGKRVRINGSFNVQDDITGDEVSLRLSDDSRARVIKAGLVEVKGGARRELSLLNLLRLRKTKRVLEVSEINAHEVTLEDVVVRGVINAKIVRMRDKASVEGSVLGEVVKEE